MDCACPHTRTNPSLADFPDDVFDRLPTDIHQQSVVEFVAVAAGEKPGFIYPSFPDPTLEVLTEILDEASVPYRVFSKPESSWLAVASTLDHYHAMPPYEDVDNLLAFEGDAQRANGRFLGVPESDLAWTVDGLGREVEPPFQPMLDVCDVQRPSNWYYLPLVSFLCRPTDAGIQRAADVGELYYEACCRARDMFGTRVPVRAAETVMDPRAAGSCFYVTFGKYR